jgi:hypothetical protein
LTPERERAAAYASLKAFFEQEKVTLNRTLDGLRDLLRQKPGACSGHELRAEASYVHDLYTSFENLFRAVAEELNGGVPKGDQWHKKLLLEMKIALPGKRPPVISEDLHRTLEECLRFRHLVRNSYGILLDPQKTRAISLLSISCTEELLAAFSSFLSALI